MRILGSILLIVAVALFASGRVGAFVGHSQPKHDVRSDLHAQDDAKASSHVHADLHEDHDHGDAGKAGSGSDGRCSTHCCSFACHFVTLHFAGTVITPIGPDTRLLPPDVVLLAGSQPLSPDRPPRTI